MTSPWGGIARLIQPADAGLAFAAAAVGSRLGAGAPWREAVAGAGAVAILVCGAAANNAWLHRRPLLLVHPSNPIATGLVKEEEAQWLGWGLLLVGIAAAATLGLRALGSASALGALLLAGNYFLEPFFAGRVIKGAARMALPAAYGWFWPAASLAPKAVGLDVLFLFFAGAAAAGYVAVETREGDELAGRRRKGAPGRRPVIFPFAASLATAATAGTASLTGAHSGFFVVAALNVALLLVAYGVVNLWPRTPDPAQAGSTARLVKFLAFLYLLLVIADAEWITTGNTPIVF